METLLAPLDGGGAGLDAVQARVWSEIIAVREEPGDDVVRHIIDWRRAGLPADADVERSARHRWVAAGFTPEQARAWTDLDIVAAEARVWRSVGQGPEEARRQRQRGGGPLPEGLELGWAAMGSDRDDVTYGVTDPPGTRGCLAGERAGDPGIG